MAIDLQIIRLLYESGVSAPDVARMFGVSDTSVRRYVRRAGGNVRRRGNPNGKNRS